METVDILSEVACTTTGFSASPDIVRRFWLSCLDTTEKFPESKLSTLGWFFISGSLDCFSLSRTGMGLNRSKACGRSALSGFEVVSCAIDGWLDVRLSWEVKVC